VDFLEKNFEQIRRARMSKPLSVPHFPNSCHHFQASAQAQHIYKQQMPEMAGKSIQWFPGKALLYFLCLFPPLNVGWWSSHRRARHDSEYISIFSFRRTKQNNSHDVYEHRLPFVVLRSDFVEKGGEMRCGSRGAQAPM
jgi:hypothetical protein